MIPIRENGRFPSLYEFLNFIAAILLTLLTELIAYAIAIRVPQPSDNIIITLFIYGVIAAIILTLGLLEYPVLIAFVINHLSGREVIGDTTSSKAVYASAYTITTSFVLPYALNGYDRKGDPYCDLYLSYSYADIRTVYETLRHHHRIIYHLGPFSLPSHLGRRDPLLTRHTAGRLLREMEAPSSDPTITPTHKRVVLCFSFYAPYGSSIILPRHQVFLSRSYIYEFLHLCIPEGRPFSPNTELTVGIGPGESISLTARYLNDCLARISAEGEFIYIPLA